MSETPAHRALTASTLALVVCGACIAALLPPWLEATLASVLRTVAVGVVLAAALLLHWIFLGIAAHRMERPVIGWVALSVLLFPIGSVTALVLLGFFDDETPAPLSVPGG